MWGEACILPISPMPPMPYVPCIMLSVTPSHPCVKSTHLLGLQLHPPGGNLCVGILPQPHEALNAHNVLIAQPKCEGVGYLEFVGGSRRTHCAALEITRGGGRWVEQGDRGWSEFKELTGGFTGPSQRASSAAQHYTPTRPPWTPQGSSPTHSDPPTSLPPWTPQGSSGARKRSEQGQRWGQMGRIQTGA